MASRAPILAAQDVPLALADYTATIDRIQRLERLITLANPGGELERVAGAQLEEAKLAGWMLHEMLADYLEPTQ